MKCAILIKLPELFIKFFKIYSCILTYSVSVRGYRYKLWNTHCHEQYKAVEISITRTRITRSAARDTGVGVGTADHFVPRADNRTHFYFSFLCRPHIFSSIFWLQFFFLYNSLEDCCSLALKAGCSSDHTPPPSGPQSRYTPPQPANQPRHPRSWTTCPMLLCQRNGQSCGWKQEWASAVLQEEETSRKDARRGGWQRGALLHGFAIRELQVRGCGRHRGSEGAGLQTVWLLEQTVRQGALEGVQAEVVCVWSEEMLFVLLQVSPGCPAARTHRNMRCVFQLRFGRGRGSVWDPHGRQRVST